MQSSAFFFQAEDGIRDKLVTGVQTCALPISCALAAGLNAATDSNASACRRLTGRATGVNAATHCRPARSGPAPFPALWGLGDWTLSVILDVHVHLRANPSKMELLQ